MRYDLLPGDGNHMGVAPDRDFLLLVPAGDDPGPAGALPYARLVKLSAAAAGTNHPLVLSMVAPASRPVPAVYTDSNGYVVFSAELHMESSSTPNGKSGNAAITALPIAIIVKGVSASF
jgi:hypothetical protein